MSKELNKAIARAHPNDIEWVLQWHNLKSIADIDKLNKARKHKILKDLQALSLGRDIRCHTKPNPNQETTRNETA